ncbi:MAG: HEAT repeat domain-containing protein [Candidatus Acidiferrales bacterium]
MEWKANQEPFAQPGAEPCKEFAERMYLLVADELTREEQSLLESHATGCGACAAFVAEIREMKGAIGTAPRQEVNADLLAACRAELSDALDDIEASKDRGRVARWFDLNLPLRWVAAHPAAAVVILLVVGFSIGVVPPRWRGVMPGQAPAAPGGSATSSAGEATASVAPAALNDQELRSADVTGINWTDTADGAPPQVEVQLKAQHPMLVQGTVANSDVKRVLLYVLHNSQRFDPDVRIESVDLLKPRSSDPDVNQALCHVVQTDRNPAVRLRALEALNGSEPQDLVRQTLVNALVEDTNPGIRVEAINTLREMAAKGEVTADPHLLEVLRERAQKDPSTYIRLQSAAMIQDLGPREKF